MSGKKMLLRFSIVMLVSYILAVAIGSALYQYGTDAKNVRFLWRTTMLLVMFGISHAAYALGWRRALALLLIAVTLSWSAEQLAVSTGLIFGRYSYTPVLGPRLGDVPVIIPLTWFVYLYCSYIVANLLLDMRPLGTDRRLARLVLTVFVTAALITAQDLVLDPIMTNPRIEAWIWEEQGAYFGIPTGNFVGWFLTASVLGAAYRLIEARWGPRSGEHLTRVAVTLPVIAYGMNAITSLLPPAPPGLEIVAFFVVGVPASLALAGIWRPVPQQGRRTDT